VKEIIAKLKKIEIRIRKTIESRTHGKFNSIFKGSGIEFSDIRDYQYGDDVRNIDWKVTAKGHGTYIRTYQEEKEQDVIIIADISGSNDLGVGDKIKYDILKELSGIITLSAVEQRSNIGLVAFTDQKELFVKPDRGIKHGYYLLHRFFHLVRQSSLTDIDAMFRYTLSVVQRKSVVIILSDFKGKWSENLLSPLAQKHDLVVIQVSDPTEIVIPKMGIIPLLDKESNKTIWINSSSKKYREHLEEKFMANSRHIESVCKKYRSRYVLIKNGEDYFSKLVELFTPRETSYARL